MVIFTLFSSKINYYGLPVGVTPTGRRKADPEKLKSWVVLRQGNSIDLKNGVDSPDGPIEIPTYRRCEKSTVYPSTANH